jgi:transposase
MSDLYWLTDEQMARLSPYFPKSHGKPRVDDRRVLSGIIFVNRNGLRWRDAPKEYGPHKTLYNRWKRWGAMGVFTQMMEGLSAQRAEPQTVMIDATYLKAHRTASSLGVKKGARTPDRADQGRHEHQASRRHRCQRPPFGLCALFGHRFTVATTTASVSGVVQSGWPSRRIYS